MVYREVYMENTTYTHNHILSMQYYLAKKCTNCDEKVCTQCVNILAIDRPTEQKSSTLYTILSTIHFTHNILWQRCVRPWTYVRVLSM